MDFILLTQDDTLRKYIFPIRIYHLLPMESRLSHLLISSQTQWSHSFNHIALRTEELQTPQSLAVLSAVGLRIAGISKCENYTVFIYKVKSNKNPQFL